MTYAEQRLGAQQRVAIPVTAQEGDLIPFYLVQYRQYFVATVSATPGNKIFPIFSSVWTVVPRPGDEVGGSYYCYDPRRQKCCVTCESGHTFHVHYAIVVDTTTERMNTK